MRAGHICPRCRREDTIVTDSRKDLGRLRRRRKCQGCAATYSTIEIISDCHRIEPRIHSNFHRGTLIVAPW